ncbi:unnamed protein product [Rotaria sp. Silwood1]|nr:unnamed protein product [Rotaria sp. Silwood1]CAF4790233.1 unnamed protein product [Rotaria sp. Silwood1]
MQRRSVPRTDPRYNQLRAKNNDSVKKSREKSRRERDEIMESINKLEQENEELTQHIRTLKQEYEQLQELFKQHTGIAVDEILSSQTNINSNSNSISTSSIQPKPIEKSKQNSSTPILTINTNEDKTNAAAATSDTQLDPNSLDGAIVLINGVQYKIMMNSSVYILCILFFIFIQLVQSQVASSTDDNNNKRKKQDFYCSACKSMSETIFREMNNVDPNERVQVGSYRVDGHGHQKLKDVPVIETAYHAENVLENLCSKFIRDAQEVIPSPLKNLYEHACDDILEDHHDSIIDILVTQNKNAQTARQLAELFCVELNQYCKGNQLDELFKPRPTPSSVVEEKQDEKNAEEEEEGKEQDKNEL